MLHYLITAVFFSDNSDTMFDSLKFGVGVVSESCFDMYDDTHIHYVYSWKYDNKPADDIEEKRWQMIL